MVLSDLGEPLTWASAEPLPHESPVFLCRCGQSNNKPFCDGSHMTADFDGTETASTETFEERRKTYEGSGLTVHRVGRICEHASFCANKTTDWYQMLPDTGDVNVRTQVIGMIEHCPSGALVYEIDGAIVEPDLPTAVSPVEDGPYWVTGGVTIVRSDGVVMETRNRVTLCRCGHSKNKPLCDGTHAEIGFVAKPPVMVSIAKAPEQANGQAAIAGVARRIVLGVSRSNTEETGSVASMIATAASSEVTLVHVGADKDADGLLADAVDIMEDAGVPADRITSERLTGHPAGTLARIAEEVDAGLIVLGRGGDRVGHVPHEVSYHSPCDVLLVSADGEGRSGRYRRILIATDGSATADRAARRGYALARALGAAVDLVFVGHPETGDLVVTDTIEVFGSGVETQSWFLEGDPVERILETAEATNTELLIVGSKGLTKTRMLLGASVPGGVLKGARCDVLLCRTVRQLESELEPGEGGVIERHGEQMAAFVDEGGELHLMSARCPHLGCTVAWDPTEKTFDCPCHGSRFSAQGDVVQGPATKPLHPI
jgi:CDGSH-type Zn-finger protein/nitrite reductase/ring-hydroxylating ferredoxin subunit